MKVCWAIALAFAGAAASGEAAAPPHGRSLASVGCDNCCFKNDCSLAFSQTTPGVCCGAHPYSSRRQTGCCPMGATCVACGHIWKCTRASYVTRSSKCGMCRDDQVRECMFRSHYGSYGHGSSSFMSMLLLLIAMCALASCFFYGRDMQPEAVYVQNGQVMGGMGGMGGMPGQVMVQPGCTRPLLPLPQTTPARARLPACPPLYPAPAPQPARRSPPSPRRRHPRAPADGGYGPGYGAGGVAMGAAGGFVGGMMVGEALDMGHHGYGGYGGEYGGGYGGDMGGGDMGFGADQ